MPTTDGEDPARDRSEGDSRAKPILALGAIVVAGAFLRGLYLWRLDLPVYDPWRHLLLVDHLRAGDGFSLFEGQPYIWYSPVWYRLCALLPAAVPIAWVSALFSLACVPLVWTWLRASSDEATRRAAPYAATLMALFGPAIDFTCHYGAEAFALALLLAALALHEGSRRALRAFVAGVLYGVSVCARTSFAFDGLLFLSVFRSLASGAAFVAGASLPLLATSWRNHAVIRDHAWLFTWDGLATRTSDFGIVSTLVPQMHPAIQEGLRRLHEQVVPVPEWILDAGGRVAWGPLGFMVLSAVCLALSRKARLGLAGAATVAYLLVLDTTMSANFFRIYLVVFPVLFAAVGLAAHRSSRRIGWASWGIVGVVLLCGAGALTPPAMYPIEMVTAPPELLTEDAYMVNSTLFHPESLMYRYPGKRFIGMPIDPAQFESFRKSFPEFRTVLWHDFSVQDDLFHYLTGEGGYVAERQASNEYGREYIVLVRPSTDRPEPVRDGGNGGQ